MSNYLSMFIHPRYRPVCGTLYTRVSILFVFFRGNFHGLCYCAILDNYIYISFFYGFVVLACKAIFGHLVL